jgi:hypothetical protein
VSGGRIRAYPIAGIGWSLVFGRLGGDGTHNAITSS